MEATKEKTRVEELAGSLERYADEHEKKAGEYDLNNFAQDWIRGLEQGEACAFRLAAMWLRRALEA